MKTVIVTGGCGYIGIHTAIELIEAGFRVVSLDSNLRSTRENLERACHFTGQCIPNLQVDLCDSRATEQAFLSLGQVHAVIHFAALKSVPESVQKPRLYYLNNLRSLANVLSCVERSRISCVVFSSSCSVYGNARELPVTETTGFGTPESPYARTKQICEAMIREFSYRTGVRCIALRYFNPVGAHPSGAVGEIPWGQPRNLVPTITQVALGRLPELVVHGADYNTRDGSCIRDYLHVCDVARAHVLALEWKKGSGWEVFNLGLNRGMSVLELIQAFERVSGRKLKYRLGPRRPGDVGAVFADSSKAMKLLGWQPRFGLDEMLSSAWRWELARATARAAGSRITDWSILRKEQLEAVGNVPFVSHA